jgi:hypothetical protein
LPMKCTKYHFRCRNQTTVLLLFFQDSLSCQLLLAAASALNTYTLASTFYYMMRNGSPHSVAPEVDYCMQSMSFCWLMGQKRQTHMHPRPYQIEPDAPRNKDHEELIRE